jgi:hypothetical protein
MEPEEQLEIDFNEWAKVCPIYRDNGRDRDTFTAGHIAGAKSNRDRVLDEVKSKLLQQGGLDKYGSIIIERLKDQ